MGLINIKPAYMYGDDYQKDEAEKQLTLEEQKLESVPNLNDTPDQSVSTTNTSSANTELPAIRSKHSKPRRYASNGKSYRTPEVKDSVFIKDLPRSLFKVIDKAIDDPKANQGEKVAAFLFSIIGDEDARDVSPYVKDLAEEYGYDTANEIRDLRESVEKSMLQIESLTKMIQKINHMNDQELFALAFLIYNRLGFSRQPPTSESDVNFNDPGVEKIRKKMQKDWKIQHDEQMRKEGVDIYHSKHEK